MTAREQRHGPVEYWGHIERFVIVYTLMTLAILQILIISEVFTDADPEFIAVTTVVYGLFGVFFAYLVMTIVGDLIEKLLFWAKKGFTDTQSQAIRSFVWGGASVFVFSSIWKSDSVSAEFAELAMVPDIVAVLFGLLLASRAVPQVVWEWLYTWLPYHRDTEQKQVQD